MAFPFRPYWFFNLEFFLVQNSLHRLITLFFLSNLKLLLIFSLYILYTTCIYIYFPSRLLFDLQIVITSLISQQQGRTFRYVCVCVCFYGMYQTNRSVSITLQFEWKIERKKTKIMSWCWFDERKESPLQISFNQIDQVSLFFSSLLSISLSFSVELTWIRYNSIMMYQCNNSWIYQTWNTHTDRQTTHTHEQQNNTLPQIYIYLQWLWN